MINEHEFMINLRRFGDTTVPEKHAQVVRKIALQALRGIVMKTPVDTGRARANWSVTLGESTGFMTEGADKAGGQTIQAGASQITKAKPLQQVIWINNNLAYIEALEYGHSGQAPQGMVAVTVAEIRAGIR